MSTMLRRIARTFRLGKERYFVGQDLEGNCFYERPGEDPTDWRQSKRTIEYVVARPLGDYQFQSMPAQWNGWMRRTRKDPPTLEELTKDYQRMQRLQQNVERLGIEYREEKLRLERGKAEALRIGNSKSTEVDPESGIRGDGVEEKMDEAPVVDEEKKKKESEVRQVEETGAVLGDQELAEKTRRDQEKEREEAKRRKEAFAKEAAAAPRGNPSDSFQPDSWAPTAARRRR